MANVYGQPVTTGVNRDGIQEMGQLMFYVGTGVFTTTGETAVIKHPFGTGTILHAAAVPLPTSSIDAQDQPLGFEIGTGANTLTRDTNTGRLKAVTSGSATVRRAASGSSGLAFSILMIGLARH